MIMQTEILIVGCGLSGAVLAREFANIGKRVLIVEKRDHIGGNCYDYVDEDTGIRVSKYGAHLFHTNDAGVWEYVNRFSKWVRYDHRVYAQVNDRIVPVPVNLETVNILTNQHLETPNDLEKWLDTERVPCNIVTNSKELALSTIGSTLYEAIFRPYTQKQWNRDPSELDPSVLARIPMRINNDTRYFSDKYQALPENGYTEFFKCLLDHPNITVRLNTEFVPTHYSYEQLIYTGPIDRYFNESGLPKLAYRSLRFEEKRYKNVGFVQQSFVINTPSSDVHTTRTIEYKHLPGNKSGDSIVIHEYPSDTGEPYYPIPSPVTMAVYEQYQALAAREEEKNVYFVGRLANYKYFNMDQAIRNSLDFFATRCK